MTSLRPDRRPTDRAQGHPRRAWVERRADSFIPTPLKPYRAKVLYVAVGAWNTLFGYGVFVVLYYLVGSHVDAVVVIVASYVIATVSAYIGYRYVAFRSHGSVREEFPRFSAVYLVTLAINLVFFPVAVRLLPFNSYVIQALFTVGVVIVSYFAHRSFSFRVRTVDGLSAISTGSEWSPGRLADTEDSAPGGE